MQRLKTLDFFYIINYREVSVCMFCFDTVFYTSPQPRKNQTIKIGKYS